MHNEYVLLLCEAAEFERDMRTILLPGLLEHQQAVQEDATDRWKMVLQVGSLTFPLYLYRVTHKKNANAFETYSKSR